jgi:hypothetical protein
VWYRFDDSKVTPFAEADIPHEAFGGSDNVQDILAGAGG